MKVRCSNLPRIFSCAGCVWAERGLKSEDSDVSLSGTRVHNAFAGLKTDRELNSREQWASDTFKAKLEEILPPLIEEHGAIITEPNARHEVSFNNGTSCGKHILTGTIDYHCQFLDGFVLLIDIKAGYKAQVLANENKQLWGYSHILIKRLNDVLPVSGIRAYIFSAGDDKETRFVPCDYKKEHFAQIKDALITRLDHCEDHTSERTPTNDGCLYCKALGTDRCQESINKAMEVTKMSEVMEGTIDAMKVAQVIQACKYAEALHRKIKARLAKEWEANQLALCDVFEEKKGSKSLSNVDVKKAHDVLISTGLISSEEFLNSTKLRLTEVKKAIKPALKERGVLVKDQGEYFNYLMLQNSVAEMKENAPSIVIKKEVLATLSEGK